MTASGVRDKTGQASRLDHPDDSPSAIDVRDRSPYLKIPDYAMQQIGYPALTFAGVLHYCDRKTRQTFAGMQTISRFARVPEKTVARHIRFMSELGWIDCRPSRNRRSHTLRVYKPIYGMIEPYVTLPSWFVSEPPGCKRRRWSVDFVFATLLSHRCMIEHAGADQPGNDYEIVAERGAISLTRIQKRTGLSRRAVCHAIQSLLESGYLIRVGADNRGVNYFEFPAGLIDGIGLGHRPTNGPADNSPAGEFVRLQDDLLVGNG